MECKYCKEKIEKPEEALLTMGLSKDYWHTNCYMTKTRGRIVSDKILSFVKMFSSDARVTVSSDNWNRKHIQFLLSIGYGRNLIGGIILGLIVLFMTLFIGAIIQGGIVGIAVYLVLLLAAIGFLYTSVFYFLNLFKHEKMIKETKSV